MCGIKEQILSLSLFGLKYPTCMWGKVGLELGIDFTCWLFSSHSFDQFN